MKSIKANILGDVRAEVDAGMLDAAFYESPDYRTLIESSDRCIVVGRRGTGKSALAYRLGMHYERSERTAVISIAPDEDEIIGLRPLVRLFGSQFRTIRAGSKIAWKYALYLEVLSGLKRSSYKARQDIATRKLQPLIDKWLSGGKTFAHRLKEVLRSKIARDADPEEIIGDLASKLDLKRLESEIGQILEGNKLQTVVLLDRLDEGYEPDDTGVGLVNGLVQAAIDINTHLKMVRPIVFLRDNIFRTVAKWDKDFSRTIEGQTIRLHWDEYSLLNLTANRLRIAFKIDQENSQKVWDRCADARLHGRDGFRKCLRLTLYRPRDLLILLNEGFLEAARRDSERIVDEDVDISAKSISTSRLDDLMKEYTAIIPTLDLLTRAFANGEPQMNVSKAIAIVKAETRREDLGRAERQHFEILDSAENCLRELYSVGFLGVKDDAGGNFVFCHDGRDPARNFGEKSQILIHPCYWIALNIASAGLEPAAAEEIYDEYEIDVISETPKLRTAEIGRLISEVTQIPDGQEGWIDFEEWALRSIRVVMAGRLTNIELHPNGTALQRRDVVATNLSASPFWRRVIEDYKSRHVMFEVKNYEAIQPDDFRQVLGYSGPQYGKLLFIVCRARDENLRRGTELDWVRELYTRHGVVAIKLGTGFLSSMLRKLRSPQKHDVVERQMNATLDKYERMYLDSSRKLK